MVLHWTCSLDVLPDTKLEMLSGFANIACRSISSVDMIQTSLLLSIFSTFPQFSECHDDGTRRIDFVKRMCITLSVVSSILNEKSDFARSCV